MTGDYAHKRDSERLPILGELHGEVTIVRPIAIKEISRGGAQIESEFPLLLDSLHEFKLTLGERSIVVKGRVTHCAIIDFDQDVVTYRSGVEFIEPVERVASAIEQFVAEIKDLRRL
jgi:hypothetical protein